MNEIRNLDGALVAKIDENGTIIIVRKGCETRIIPKQNAQPEITHVKLKTAK
jgi:hypothetical protein